MGSYLVGRRRGGDETTTSMTLRRHHRPLQQLHKKRPLDVRRRRHNKHAIALELVVRSVSRSTLARHDDQDDDAVDNDVTRVLPE